MPMIIQSLSVCVPAGCPNKCKFCVSAMNRQPDNTYENLIEKADGRLRKDYANRLAFARDNGCNTMMYTSSGEALMNRRFIQDVAEMNRGLANPFRWVELQTSGVMLDDEMLCFLRYGADVDVIALSLSDAFDSTTNAEINDTPLQLYFNIDDLCKKILQFGFGLRLCLNLNDSSNNYSPRQIFERASDLGANYVTVRKLFVSDIYKGTSQAEWIEQHPYARYDEINEYIIENGTPMGRLPFGEMRYSVHNMSTVVDTNCMNKGVRDDGSQKYLILRPDCRLYTNWDRKGSILF